MAGGTLLEALQASRYDVRNNPAAAMGISLAETMPSLYNPYGSNKKNLLTTAGIGLLAALLGNYGRKQNDADNLNLYRSARGLLNTQDPNERMQLIEQNPRLADFGNVIQSTEYQNELDLLVKQKELEQQQAFEIEKVKAEKYYDNFPSQARPGALLTQGLTGTRADVPSAPDPVMDQSVQLPVQKIPQINQAPEQGRLLEQALTQPEMQLTEKQQMAIDQKVAESGAVKQADIKRLGFDPDKEKEINDLRKEFNALPEVKNFSQVEKAASIVDKALKDDNAVTDLELTRYAILMIEPGMAVREGEQAAVLKSGSFPQQWAGALTKTLNGKSALPPEIRAGLKELAVRAYEGHKMSYDKAYNFYGKQAELKSIDPTRLSYLGESRPTEEIFPQKIVQPIPQEYSSQESFIKAYREWEQLNAK